MCFKVSAKSRRRRDCACASLTLSLARSFVRPNHVHVDSDFILCSSFFSFARGLSSFHLVSDVSLFFTCRFNSVCLLLKLYTIYFFNDRFMFCMLFFLLSFCLTFTWVLRVLVSMGFRDAIATALIWPTAWS